MTTEAPGARAGATVIRLAPAKLNLTLAIMGRRDDGFHDLHSVMVPLDLADRLSVAPAAGDEDSLHVEGLATGPLPENLVLRAIALARSELRRSGSEGAPGAGGPPRPLAPLAIRLEKRIPVAAGLGGGSSDAAAALDAALEAWGVPLPEPERRRVAIRLGSDVPFFLAGGPALVRGRGEDVAPLASIGAGHDGLPAVLLVTPALPLSTAEVYAAFDAGHRPARGAGARAASEHLAGELARGLSADTFLSRAAVMASANDLWPAAVALVPELVTARRALARLLRRPIGQSGSGPTSWVLYPSLQAAERAAEELRTAVDAGALALPGSSPPAIAAARLAGHALAEGSGRTHGKEESNR